MSERTTINVILVEPRKPPHLITLEDSLEAMQNAVKGQIEQYMPFEDEVALVCNDDGKWKAMELNRAIYNEEGQMMDIIAGPFFIAYAPIGSENYLSLPDDLREKYMERFKHPEMFMRSNTGIVAIPIIDAREAFER